MSEPKAKPKPKPKRTQTRDALKQEGFHITRLISKDEKERIGIYKWLFGANHTAKSLGTLKAIAKPRLVDLFTRCVKNREKFLQLRGTDAFWKASRLNLHGPPKRYLLPERTQALVEFYSEARSNWRGTHGSDELTKIVDEYNAMKWEAEQLPTLPQLTLTLQPRLPEQEASTDAANDESMDVDAATDTPE